MPTLEYARSFCGKTSRLYKDENFECINVMYDEADGTRVCIVDFFRREEDDAEATFVFVKNPRGKWDVAPKHIEEIHKDRGDEEECPICGGEITSVTISGGRGIRNLCISCGHIVSEE